MSETTKCRLCDGEGRTDGHEDVTERAPWSFWENLAPGQDIAVRLGLVKPIDCTECNGTGIHSELDDDFEPSNAVEAYLLAKLRKQAAALDKVRAAADYWAKLADGDKYYAKQIHDALGDNR